MVSPPSRFTTREELAAYRERVWAEHTYTYGGFKFLWITGQVWVGDVECARLTETEADVLHTLIEHWPNAMHPCQVLASLSVECRTAPEDMKVWIRRIRRKVGVDVIATSDRGWSFNAEGVM